MIAIGLLRGVNVGGVRIAMAELVAALTAEGFTRVRTVLASGNVVVTTDLVDPADVAAEIARVVEARFGHRIAVIGVAVHTLQSAVDAYPFPRAEDRHAYVVFGERPAALDELRAAAGDLDPAVERVEPGHGVLYWDAPKGATLTTAFGRRYGRMSASGAVTTRNLATLEKVLAVAD